jgi:hypothetical protein
VIGWLIAIAAAIILAPLVLAVAILTFAKRPNSGREIERIQSERLTAFGRKLKSVKL